MGKRKVKHQKQKKPSPFLNSLIWSGWTILALSMWALVLSGGTGEDTLIMLMFALALTLIVVVHWRNKWKARKSRRSGTKVLIDDLNGLEFEHFCADVLKRNSFTNVRVTQASGDFGADIIATDEKGYMWVFQCKRYKSKLGNTPIQEVAAARLHYKARFAGVITNQNFTPAARQLAHENGVTLIEREALFRMNGKTKEKPKLKHPVKKKSSLPAAEEDWVEELIMYDEIFDD